KTHAGRKFSGLRFIPSLDALRRRFGDVARHAHPLCDAIGRCRKAAASETRKRNAEPFRLHGKGNRRARFLCREWPHRCRYPAHLSPRGGEIAWASRCISKPERLSRADARTSRLQAPRVTRRTVRPRQVRL